MKSHEGREIKLAVLVVFCTLALGSLVSQRTAYAVSLPQSAQTKNPLQPTEKNIALGLDHFDAHCASCHGPTGRADIEKGKAVKAADLTSEKIQSKSDGELFRKISSGVSGTAMPAFGKTHKPAEIWQTILFLRKLPTLTPEGRKKLEAAVPANARHKHGAGKGEEHHHPEAEAPTQPEPDAHDMSKMGKENAGTGDAHSGHDTSMMSTITGGPFRSMSAVGWVQA